MLKQEERGSCDYVSSITVSLSDSGLYSIWRRQRSSFIEQGELISMHLISNSLSPPLPSLLDCLHPLHPHMQHLLFVRLQTDSREFDGTPLNVHYKNLTHTQSASSRSNPVCFTLSPTLFQKLSSNTSDQRDSRCQWIVCVCVYQTTKTGGHSSPSI